MKLPLGQFAKLCMLAGTLAVFTNLQSAKGQNCTPLPQGLIAWWSAEGNANDQIGGLNGFLQGNVTFAPGKVGQAFAFDGVNSTVQIPYSPILDIGNQVTVELWMKADGDPLPTCCAGLVTTDFYLIEMVDTGSQHVSINASIQNTNGAFGHTGNANGGAFATVSSNVWHHVAFTYDGLKMQLYIDGAKWGNPLVLGGDLAPMINGSYLAFGSHDGRSSCPSCVNSRYFKGLIDEIALYNRALSASEIQAIYNAGGNGKCFAPTPPIIFSQPSSQSVVVGQNLSFNTIAGGTQPLSYQWQVNGTNITGATQETLAITNVSLSQSGNYSVTITNLQGMVISTNAPLTVFTPPPCVALPSGLIGWWSAEGNANDSVGTLNGVLQGNVTFAPGKVGQAFAFDGMGSSVRIPFSPILDAGGQVTVELWMKADGDPLPTCCAGLVTTDFYLIEMVGTGPQRVSINASVQNTNGVYGHTGNANGGVFAPVSSNDWHHVAFAYDGLKMQLYVDGTNWGNPLVLGGGLAPMLSGSYLAFGSHDGRSSCPTCVNSRYFKGSLDEIGIYNRALSPTEIAAIYNAGAGGKCVAPTAPFFFAQPTNQTVTVGSSATFAAVAGGSAPIAYQWRFNGNDISGATNSTFVLTNIQPSKAGLYSVRATNSLGATTSSNANLQVIALFAFGNGQPLTNSAYSFSNLVTVQIQSLFTNGQTYYTLDGSQPSFLSMPYTAPFAVSTSSILRVLGYRADFQESSELGPINIILPPSYTLTATTPGGGSVALNPPGGSYLSNATVTVTATPASGWTFLQWLGDFTGTNNPASIAVTRNKQVQAIFGAALGTSTAGNGSVTKIPSSPLYPYGNVVTLSAVPQPGNFFGVWGNAASGNANPLYFTVTNSGQSVSSLFAALSGGQSALAVVPNGFGHVTISPQANAYTTGASVTLTAVPDAGQKFLSWSGDASASSNPLNVTMSTSKTITANFTAQPRLFADPPLNGFFPEGFRLTLNGEFGRNYQIESSSNGLVWPPLVVVTNTYNQSQTTIPTNVPIRLIRALRLP